ncbi:MAG: DUF4465 domain-containing protein [Bacteroidota bacterium]|nr:DUF4465 domain-containing protein [Bacteroidota bacterium]
MKKIMMVTAGLILATNSIKAQTNVVDFENFTLPTDSFYLDTTSADFVSGISTFQYDWTQSQWGDYWSGGFSYSNMKDSVTSGYMNPYSTKAAIGYNNSSNYAVSQNFSMIKLSTFSAWQAPLGFYVTNSTYAYNSMRDGDAFGKKFGGTSGDDQDWFKLLVRGYSQGVLTNDSVEFYLADFRFANNSQDYILKTWEYVNLSPLGVVDSLVFELKSSDVGAWGMNTPAYFCMDNFESLDVFIGIKETGNENVSLYPNPAKSNITIHMAGTLSDKANYVVFDITGKEVLTGTFGKGVSSVKLTIENLERGVYFVRITNGNEIISKKIIKE